MSQNVLRFALEMQRELDINKHKSGWWNLTPKQCLNRLRQETAEVARAISQNKTPDKVTSECADVANFAMFLSNIWRDLKMDEVENGE